VTDLFRCDGPTLLSVSGGRTSGVMLARVLETHGGALPPDTFACFADTGREFPATYEFLDEMARRWGVTIHRVMREGGFDALITQRRFLPNPAMRFCTQALKIEPMRQFMLARGFTSWTNVVGIRADEPRRVARVRQRETERPDKHYVTVLPLADSGTRRADVMAFWARQPFDLALAPHESNCDLCFLKSMNILRRIMREHPGRERWWIEQEARVGGRFQPHRPDFAAIYAGVTSNPVLPFDDDDDDDSLIDCICGD
jgi:3'-phosphoadenosine 5'-phosphosulfate sulfotransferase (PAPS reductase)/FAD synthetase